jgi:TPR repeat protein
MYSQGRGVPRDDAQAVAWYRKAAEQNLPLGQMNLGAMYLTGRGVPKDEAQAMGWFQKAAAQGEEQAKKKLAMLDELRQLKRHRTEFAAALVAAVAIPSSMIAFRIARERASGDQSVATQRS